MCKVQEMTTWAESEVSKMGSASVVVAATQASNERRNGGWQNRSPMGKAVGMAAMHKAVEMGWVSKSDMCF